MLWILLVGSYSLIKIEKICPLKFFSKAHRSQKHWEIKIYDFEMENVRIREFFKILLFVIIESYSRLETKEICSLRLVSKVHRSREIDR